MKIKIITVSFDGFGFVDTNDKDEDVKRLLHDSDIFIKYMLDGVEKTFSIQYKRGFLCDGASTPRIAKWVLKPWHTLIKKDIPAILHDGIYVFGGDDIDKCPMTFEEANELFYELLLWFKSTSKFKAKLAWLAVASPIGKRCFTTTNKYDRHNYKYVTWS